MKWLTFSLGLAGLLPAIAGSGCEYNGGRGDAMTIWEAVEREDLGAIEAYVRNGGDLDVGARKPGRTPLLCAMVLNKKKSYSKLLSLGANPNTLCRGGGDIQPPNSSVVHYAAREEDSFWLRAALEANGDPNRMNEAEGLSKGTPLYAAIGNKGGIENVRLLCEHGAHINAPADHLGLTAITDAVSRAEFEIVYYLLERGADVAEPRPVHEGNTFIFSMRQKKPQLYATEPLVQEWCNKVWEWLRSHGKDPEKAKWNGSKWTWDKE